MAPGQQQSENTPILFPRIGAFFAASFQKPALRTVTYRSPDACGVHSINFLRLHTRTRVTRRGERGT